jgi:hypothetical protein
MEVILVAAAHTHKLLLMARTKCTAAAQRRRRFLHVSEL